MASDLELAGRPRHIENDRFRPVQAKDVQAFEWRYVAEQYREARNELGKRGAFGYQPRDRREQS